LLDHNPLLSRHAHLEKAERASVIEGTVMLRPSTRKFVII